MDTTFIASMGDRGRLVVPAELRTRQQWEPGTALIFIETANGIVVTSREQAKTILRTQLAGDDLVATLLAERRSAAHDEDGA